MAKFIKPEIKQPGENTWPFKLGDEVKDKINGIRGVLVNRYYHMTGCDRFSIERINDEKPDLYHVDAGRLELVTAHTERHIDEVPALHVRLGDKVRDSRTGLLGRVGIINIPLFGAPQASIDPDWDAKEKRLPEGYFVDIPFIEVIEPYDGRPKSEQMADPAGSKKSPGACRMPSERTRRALR